MWIGEIKALFYFHLFFLWYFSFLMQIWVSDLHHFPSLRGTSLMFLGRKLYYNEFTHFHFSEKLIISLHFHGCRILVWYFFLLKYATPLSSSFHCIWWDIWCNSYLFPQWSVPLFPSTFFQGFLCLWFLMFEYDMAKFYIFESYPA